MYEYVLRLTLPKLIMHLVVKTDCIHRKFKTNFPGRYHAIAKLSLCMQQVAYDIIGNC